MPDGALRRAGLHRMETAEHVCPWGLKTRGLKTRGLLRRDGHEVDDNTLTSRAEIDAVRARHDVETTPQVFIGGERIGGYEEALRFPGKEVRDPDAVTHAPVSALFAMAAAMALAVSWATHGSVVTIAAAEWFIAISMCLLALQKLKDVESFATMVLNYALLAQRWGRYGHV